MEIVGTSSQSMSPSIFKLTVDCCDEIFEYLSTKDLHSFGQTCKAMQKVTGEYFMRNCAGAEKFIKNDGIYTCYYDHEGASNEQTLTSGFNRYITNISYKSDLYGLHPRPYKDSATLRYIESHSDEFDSVKNINLMNTHVISDKVRYFRKVLPKIEHVRLYRCTAEYKRRVPQIHAVFLKYCENMTHLWIQDDFGYILSETCNVWLSWVYPKLKFLHLSLRHSEEISELTPFFRRNPNLEVFSTCYCFLHLNQWRISSDAKFETLIVEYIQDHIRLKSLSIYCALKRLHREGVYKRLHLSFEKISKKLCDDMILVLGIEKLRFDQFTEIYNVPQMTTLKELHLPGGLKVNDIQTLATNLLNLETVTISSISSNDLLPFMRHSAKLRKLHAFLNERILNLPKLNKEREKSANVRKVIIYVRDDIFLATKWTTHYGDTNLKLVEMRRSNSA